MNFREFIQRNWLFLLVNVLVLYSIIVFLYQNDVFSNSYLMMGDYPIHYFRSSLLFSTLIPQFQSVFGFDLLFYAGHPDILVYPVGFYLLTAFIMIFGVSATVALKVILFGATYIFEMLPYYLTQKCGCKKIISCVSVILFVFGPSMQLYYFFFQDGMLPFNISVMFVIFFFYFYSKRIDSPGPFFCLRTILLIGTLVLACLFDFMSLIFIAFGVGIYLIHVSIKSKSFSFIKTELLFFFKICICFGGIISFWAFPTILIGAQNIDLPTYSIDSTYQFSMDVVLLVNQTIGWFAVINLSAFFLLFFRKKLALKSSTRFIYFMGVSTLAADILCFIVPQFHFEFLLGINSVRYYVFFEICGIVCLSIFLESVIMSLKNYIEEYRANRTSKHTLHRIRQYSLLCASIGFLMLVQLPFQNFNVPKFSFSKNWSNSFTPTFSQVISWINNNTDNTHRIMIEDSNVSDPQIYPTEYCALLPSLTNRSYIGGYLSSYWYKYTLEATCQDGMAFDQSFSTMSLDFFLQNLQTYNIQDIIVWSDSSKAFLNSHPMLFLNRANYGNFSIFTYLDASYSYVLPSRPDLNYQILQFLDNSIEIIFWNYTVNDSFTVSVHNFVNWKMRYNNTDSSIDPSQVFLGAKFLENNTGEVIIQFYWEKTPIEQVSDGLSITSIVLLIGIVIYKWRKTKKDHYLTAALQN